MNTSPAPHFTWAIGVLARALCTNNQDILNDKRLEYLRRCILQEKGGYGKRDGLSVIYMPVDQILRFDCGSVGNAVEVAESTIGARCRHVVAVPMPFSIARPKFR